MLKQAVAFIFFSSIFISVCAVALCVETNILLGLPLNAPTFYGFIFGGVLIQYNVHYLVKKTSHEGSSHFYWSLRHKRTHAALVVTGILFLVPALFTFNFIHFAILASLGLITLLYSLPVLPFKNKKRLKDFGLLKIFTLVLLWTIITTILPSAAWQPLNLDLLLVFCSRFIYLFALCLLFDARDVSVDTLEKIRTIPVLIGTKRTYRLHYFLLLVFLSVCILRFYFHPVFPQLNAMILSTLATVIMTMYVKKHQGDIAYLACVDGMMLLQCLLVISGSV